MAMKHDPTNEILLAHPDLPARARELGYFDPDFYKSQFALPWQGVDAFGHFLRTWREHFASPSPKFDLCRYLAAYPEVWHTGINPLIHYLTHTNLTYSADRRYQPFHRDGAFDRQEIFASLSAAGGNLYNISFRHRRVAVFSFFDKDYIIRDRVIYLLEQLREVCDAILFIADNYLPITEILKIRHLIAAYQCERFGEYDFGAYKRGIELAARHNLLGKIDELVLCNDSVYGPIVSMPEIFAQMDAVKCDFWGITSNGRYVPDHLQSYFTVYKKNVFSSQEFREFFRNVQSWASVEQVISAYEIPLTGMLEGLGFRRGQLMDHERHPEGGDAAINNYNLTLNPVYSLAHGLPFLKRRPLAEPLRLNRGGVLATFDVLAAKSRSLYNLARQDYPWLASREFRDISFSVIMATYDRGGMIRSAIDSLLAQSWQNFELVIVDDGSTDDTEAVIRANYGAQLASGRIIYKKLPVNMGVTRARNEGLALASREWIAYLDSDNAMREYFLEYFAIAIYQNPREEAFYSTMIRLPQNVVIGAPYDRAKLEDYNYIDLGAFVHKRALYERLGGFDEELRRMVDYELILRYTRAREPVFLPLPLLLYNNGDHPRISNCEDYDIHKNYLDCKFQVKTAVSIIIALGGEDGCLRGALDSALMQEGEFAREIWVASAGDRPLDAAILEEYRQRYPGLVRLVPEEPGELFARMHGQYACFMDSAARWTDAEKIRKQLDVFAYNDACAMCLTGFYSTFSGAGGVALPSTITGPNIEAVCQAARPEELFSTAMLPVAALKSELAGEVNAAAFAGLLLRMIAQSLQVAWLPDQTTLAAPASNVAWPPLPAGRPARMLVAAGRQTQAKKKSCRVSIIMPYGGARPDAAIASIYANTPEGLDWELVMAGPESWRPVRRDGRMRFIRARRSHAAACAQAAAGCRGEFLAFISPSLEAQPGWLEMLLEEMEKHPETGIAGGRVVRPDASVAWAGLSVNRSLLPENVHAGKEMADPALARREVVSAVSEKFMLIRRQLFKRLGGFDGALSSELRSMDLCLKAKAQNSLCVYRPESMALLPASEPEQATRGEDAFLKRHRAHIVQNDFAHVGARVALPEKSWRFAIKIGPPNRSFANWGDVYFAESLAAALIEAGHACVIHYKDEWELPDRDIDVALKISGIDPYEPKPWNINLLWMISHPELHTMEDLGKYDGVCVASRQYAAYLGEELARPVFPLLQAANTDVFYPAAGHVSPLYDAVFVGSNAQGPGRLQVRKMIADFLPRGPEAWPCRLDVWGDAWEGILDPARLHGMLPWREQADIYRQSRIVLTDHHPEMLRHGFINDRTFNAIACGVPVISDCVAGLGDILDIPVCGDHESLRRAVGEIMANPGQALARAAANRRLVLESFTFRKRASDIVRILEKIDNQELRQRVRAFGGTGC